MPAPTTPQLPEDFGNPWMSNLQEIEIPEPVPFRPETVGWYGLAGLLVLALLWLAWRFWRRWKAAAYRRTAERQLDVLAAEATQGLRALPELLKRVALAAYPRNQVAELSGDAWLRFLDQSMGTDRFTQGAGRWLPDLAYDSGSVSRLSRKESDELFSLAERWIRNHRGD